MDRDGHVGEVLSFLRPPTFSVWLKILNPLISATVPNAFGVFCITQWYYGTEVLVWRQDRTKGGSRFRQEAMMLGDLIEPRYFDLKAPAAHSFCPVRRLRDRLVDRVPPLRTTGSKGKSW